MIPSSDVSKAASSLTMCWHLAATFQVECVESVQFGLGLWMCLKKNRTESALRIFVWRKDLFLPSENACSRTIPMLGWVASIVILLTSCLISSHLHYVNTIPGIDGFCAWRGMCLYEALPPKSFLEFQAKQRAQTCLS